MRQYRAQARAQAIKIVNFSVPAEALAVRNFLGALLSEKGTII